METADLQHRYDAVLNTLRERGQEHVLRWWDVLDSASRQGLLTEIEAIPWELLDPLIQSHVLTKPSSAALHGLKPPSVFPLRPNEDQRAFYAATVAKGRKRIRSGQVAAMTVAGGQGARLGHAGPKGTVCVTPVGQKTLFELFAETIKAAGRAYEVAIPWYIMTGASNHVDTVSFFRDRDYFGLAESDVIFFAQAMLPAFDFQARLLLAAKDRLALAPDGHGGSLKALVSSGALQDMQARGVEVISYFQVDNPLVKPFDPLFLGLHAETGSEMSTKVTAKADDLERVGSLAVRDRRLHVIEYSEFPETLARAKNPDGSRMFSWGNLAIHLIDVAFVDRIVAGSFQLPYRRAEKIVATVDETGAAIQPAKPNGIKLETFVFDALSLANQPLLLEADRAEEFSPVKNATGTDSLETSKRDQVARACRWLESAGVNVPRKPDGSPAIHVMISPSLALEADDLKLRLDRIPPLRAGEDFDLS